MKAAGTLPGMSARLGFLTRTNSEALGGAMTRLRNREKHDFTAASRSPRRSTRTSTPSIEPVRYGKGSNAMGLLSTVMTDGDGPAPRWVKWLAQAARHPGRLASLYLGLSRWSERS